ncbi:HAD-IIIC family phosphatase [Psychrobacter sp. AOP7-C1-14]|uniref:HAD-IIIC family phosphatase n=1 Tax=Psychrobacter sp. AOP7-C1-14 TaxID=3457640 RepID=UPI00402BE5C3
MNVTVVSDFNSEPFANLLSNYLGEAEVVNMPYGQVYQNLINIINAADNSEQLDIDFLVIWTRAENLFPEYHKAVKFVDCNISSLNEELNDFISILQKCSKVVKNILMFSWTKPPQNYLHGMLDYKTYGPQYLTNYLNNKFTETTQEYGNIHVVNFNDLVVGHKENVFDNQMKHLIKMPYNLDFLKKVSEFLLSCIEGVLGKSRRVLVLDLDNTLWGGILGDDGTEGIKIGGHDAVGEAFLDFQKVIKTLKNRGVALAIASKNYEENAIHALENNQEMHLKKDDFSAWRINWKDKAANLVEIAEELNLGLSSLVFIDDNPVERGRVSETLPDVYVPDWPESPADYAQALLSLTCFNVSSISDEDKKRVEMFAAEKDRKQFKENLSHDDWLKSIKINVDLEDINENNKKRIVQLLNKSNQFNAISRRFSEVEIDNWLEKQSRYCWAYRVSDKYGESGLTAVVTFEIYDSCLQIYDFVMSCRVMGRNIENLVLKSIIDFAIIKDKPEIRINYEKTDRNKPMKDFLENRSGFSKVEDVFVWDNRKEYGEYSYIQLNDTRLGTRDD